MSGPNPPGRETEEPESVSEHSRDPDSGGDPGDKPDPHGEVEEISPYDALEPLDDSAEIARADQTGQTDAYSRAYSAPEVEHFTSGPYVPADPRLYDYDSYQESADSGDEHGAPRWPWVIGVAAIVAAVALVVSVSLLVARTDTNKLANPGTTATVRAADTGRDHHHHAAPAAPAHRDPNSYGDPNSDGDACATTAPARAGPRAAAGNHDDGAASAADDHHTGRPASGHLFGDRHQSAG